VYSELTRLTVGRVILIVSRTIGEGLITFGLVVLLFAAYEVWGVGAKVDAHQSDLSDQLAQDWNAAAGTQPSASASAPPPPMDGAGIAKLYIPKIKDKPWVLVQGVQPDDIRYAPGHDPATAMPGEIGNIVIAGHRSPPIFWDLDLVGPGDPIVLETRDSWFVYKVTRTRIVSKNGVQILDPNPDNPGEPAEEKMMTVFTCYPKTGNEQRLVLHALLESQQPHDSGYPSALGR
jgi:sortase A